MCQLFSMTSFAMAIAAPMMIIGILSIAWYLLLYTKIKHDIVSAMLNTIVSLQ